LFEYKGFLYQYGKIGGLYSKETGQDVQGFLIIYLSYILYNENEIPTYPYI